MPNNRKLRIDDIAASIRGFFDEEYYRRQLDERGIATGGTDLLLHYIKDGALLGLDPNDHFSSRYYLGTYPDVAAAKLNPLWHYIAHGQFEGRSPSGPDIRQISAAIRAEFDEQYYLEQLSQRGIGVSGTDLVDHYIVAGAQLGLDPCTKFSTSQYISAYPDVEASNLNPFFHFLTYGRVEGSVQ